MAMEPLHGRIELMSGRETNSVECNNISSKEGMVATLMDMIQPILICPCKFNIFFLFTVYRNLLIYTFSSPY